ncbi:MAG TPA: hypothetical protein EYP43_03350 [Thermoplasmata archaeon]|nr:hypothetical protein [Thermoplasmata archaeon]
MLLVLALLILAAIIATLRKPTVESATVTSATPGVEYVDVRVLLDVKNPNIIGGRLKELDAKVYLDGEYIGPAHIEKEYDVPAGKTTQIEVVLRVQRVAAGTRWDAAGTATIEVFGQTFEIPFDTR